VALGGREHDPAVLKVQVKPIADRHMEVSQDGLGQQDGRGVAHSPDNRLHVGSFWLSQNYNVNDP
jgi:hypothetical protein